MLQALPVEKMVLGEIEKCYAVLGLEADGQPLFYYGGEGNGSVRAYRGTSLERCDLIWESGGGTMSIVPMPGKPGWALISRGFYSMVDCETSTIELVRYQNGAFAHAPVAALPFLHRFDTLLAPDGTRYVFAATLHSGKKDKEDWSTPGRLFAGALPADMDEPFQVALAPLPGDFYMNHGFCKGLWQGREAGFTASQEGVFAWLPPENRGGEWRREQLLSLPVSDVAVLDIDGDGQPELAVLLPFHGNQCKVYHLDGGEYKEVFDPSGENDFYHAVIGGSIGGEKLFCCGARKGRAELYLIRWNGQGYETQLLDAGFGPSNLSLARAGGGDWLLSANRMTAQAAVYRF